MVSDESEMAGLLNRYFSSTFTQEQPEELPIAESIYRGGEEGLLQKIQVGVEDVKEQQGTVKRGDFEQRGDFEHFASGYLFICFLACF